MADIYIEHELATPQAQLLHSLPMLIVVLVGVLLCVVRRSRPRQARILATISLLLTSGLIFGGDAIIGWLLSALQHKGTDPSLFAADNWMLSPDIWIAAVMSLSSMLTAIILGLLVVAALTPDAPR